MKPVTVALLLAALATAGCGGSLDRQARELSQSVRLALQQGRLPEAEALAARGLTLTSSQPDSDWARTFALLRAEVLIGQNKLADAAPLLAAPLPPDPHFDSLRSHQLYLNARVSVAGRKLAEALDLLQRAGSLAPTGDQRLKIDILVGQVRLRLGQWAEGESALNAVVTEAGRINDRYHQALALNDLGMGNVVRRQFDRALPWFERILAMTELKELPLYSRALYNAGICYARLGQFERAMAVQQEAVETSRTRGSNVDREQALGQLGTTYLQLGNNAEGLKFLREAFDIARQSNLTDDATLWASNMASAFIDLGDWAEAKRYNDEARRIREEKGASERLVHNALNDGHIAAGLGRVSDAERSFTAALAASGGAAHFAWEAQAGLASAAFAAGQPARAARHFEATLDTIEHTRSELLKSDYKVSFLSRLIQFYQAYVDQLIDQGQTARALEIADSSRARVLAERHGVTPPARASSAVFRRVAADSGTLLVSYWLGPDRSYAWAVSASGIKFATLPAAKTIEDLVKAHQAMIANSLADPLAATNTAGDQLYRLLVEPLVPRAPEGAAIVIVPDGALHGLNFETLPVNGSRRHYWIEDVEIQVAPSLTTLTVEAGDAEGDDVQRSLLVMGDPTPHPPEFPRLGYAAAEMTAVAARFRTDRVTRIELDRASPEAYRQARPDQFTFVHFAAHATTNLESPLDSAVILSGPDHAYKLYARDVAAQPLRAELVTVSACRSAGERAYSGEGLVGFAWAFLRAGARRVIAGLWDVDDRSTADLMGRLYEHLAAGAEPADALRRAKLAMIQEGGARAKPYYWAPLELFTLVLSPPSRTRAPPPPTRTAASRVAS